MADNTVCAVDLGTHKIVALIGDISPEGLRITGVGKTSVNAVNSRGTITNIEELRTKVELAVEEAEKMADVQVNTVYVNLFGDNVECFMTRGTVTVSSPDVGVQSDDLSRVLSDVKNNFLLKDEHEIVHILARNFIVDEMTGIKDPIGIKGSRLEAEVYVVTALRSLLSNIESVIENSGFELGDFVYEPLAASEAVLSVDEKKLGAAVIDIGGAYTNVCVYKNGTIL
ncbi:MAG: cell division protein FtsA, partial [Candidatus Muiribacteriaceae bacterium]